MHTEQLAEKEEENLEENKDKKEYNLTKIDDVKLEDKTLNVPFAKDAKTIVITRQNNRAYTSGDSVKKYAYGYIIQDSTRRRDQIVSADDWRSNFKGEGIEDSLYHYDWQKPCIYCDCVNNGQTDYNGRHFYQLVDIDLAGIEFPLIGTYSRPLKEAKLVLLEEQLKI